MDNQDRIVLHTSYFVNKSYEYHFHLHYEIIYISAGKATIFSDGHDATLPAGTVCVIPPFTPHRIEYINASVRRIIFGISYISRYLLRDAIDNFPQLYATNVTLSRRSRNAEIIETLVEEINQYKGESAYIYIYKLMSDCVAIPQFQTESKLIVKIMRHIGDNSRGKIALEDVAQACGVSKYHICRIFKKEFDITPVDYITFARIRRAVLKILNTNTSITKISDELGFYSPKYFTKLFKSYFGVSPSQFRRSDNLLIKDRYFLKPHK